MENNDEGDISVLKYAEQGGEQGESVAHWQARVLYKQADVVAVLSKTYCISFEIPLPTRLG